MLRQAAAVAAAQRRAAEDVNQEIDQTIVQAHHLLISRDEFLNLVHQRMDALEHKRRANADAAKVNEQ